MSYKEVHKSINANTNERVLVIIFLGVLKKGAVLVAGTSMGKVRALRDENGQILKEVLPGFSAEIEGWKELAPAGELVLEVESERRAREVVRVREQKEQLKKQEKDAVAIASKREEHLKEYKERLKLKRAMGRMKLKREGPRKPEIEEGEGFFFIDGV